MTNPTRFILAFILPLLSLSLMAGTRGQQQTDSSRQQSQRTQSFSSNKFQDNSLKNSQTKVNHGNGTPDAVGDGFSAANDGSSTDDGGNIPVANDNRNHANGVPADGFARSGSTATNQQYDQTNATYQQTAYTSDTEDTGSSNALIWLALFLAVAALAVASYNYKTLRPKKKSRSRQHRGARNDNDEVDDNSNRASDNKLRAIIRQNQDLTRTNQDFANRLAFLESEFSRLRAQMDSGHVSNQQAQGGLQKAETGQSNRSGRSDSGQLLYATLMIGNGFPSEGLTGSNNDSVLAVLTVNGNNGTYVINTLSSAQQTLIGNFAYGAGRICEVKLQAANATRIETERPGRVQFLDDIWHITEKAQVRLV